MLLEFVRKGLPLTFGLPNLAKDYTCYFETHKLSVNLISTNKERSFQHGIMK